MKVDEPEINPHLLGSGANLSDIWYSNIGLPESSTESI